uniref:Uncharacterized protein n=1 Tax=Oryza meridionalis TaxID=40149 RepID=A0A0E0DUT6_9ORYZ
MRTPPPAAAPMLRPCSARASATPPATMTSQPVYSISVGTVLRVLEDTLFCLQCLPLLASDKLTLEHKTSKTRRSRKTLEWLAGWPQESWDVGSMLRRSNISLLASGRSGRTNCRYRTREKGAPIPSCPTPLRPNINKATNLSSLVFAIMYMAKIVVTGQELLSKLTVSLGWKNCLDLSGLTHQAGNRGGGVLAFVGS